jgi:hypothetical protein
MDECFFVYCILHVLPAQDAEGKKVQEELQIFEEVKFGINVIRRNVQMIEGLKTQSNRTFDQKVFQGNNMCYFHHDLMYMVYNYFLLSALISALVFAPSIPSSLAPSRLAKNQANTHFHIPHTHILSPSQLHDAQRS